MASKIFGVFDPLGGMDKATDGFDLLIRGLSMLPARERERTIEHFSDRAKAFFRKHDAAHPDGAVENEVGFTQVLPPPS